MSLTARLMSDWFSTPAPSDRCGSRVSPAPLDYELYLLLCHVSAPCLQEFPLGRFNNKKDLKDAVKKMAYMERGTMTGQALRYLTDSSFSSGQGARPGVSKVGIVFTDGRSQDYIGDAAKKAKELGMKATSS